MKVGLDSLPKFWPYESDWSEQLDNELRSDSFLSLQDFIIHARFQSTVFPPEPDVYNAFRFCSFAATKVVILGQDPYHGKGQAHGLSFSVQGDQRLPPSLKNIFKEMRDDIGCDNQTGDLTPWSRQGVFLLNTVLTVESGQAHSHRNRGWELFTDGVIEKLGQREKPVVFVLWGNHAIKKNVFVADHHRIIQSPHPSPLSAHRGFFGSRPFSRINDALIEFGDTPVRWQL